MPNDLWIKKMNYLFSREIMKDNELREWWTDNGRIILVQETLDIYTKQTNILNFLIYFFLFKLYII